ncbi:MAG: molybdopterin-synthase adenylyltransferase MoeB [Cyanobacteria bacterium HKST-UBA02]|nr:molybdopterin-synthase adenylyltransferase MoeB [Cyanobacteria bacterium HKST-UBA02]
MSDEGLSRAELLRYSRHLLLREVGLAGQSRLKASRALVVGAGGLGSPVLQYLAAAGVGTIGVVDFDTVDMSNLQRQTLYETADVGARKVDRVAARLAGINPEIEIVPYAMRLSAENALELVGAYDVVIDGTDNFNTRYLVNDASVLSGKPNVHAAIYRFEGQISVFGENNGPCYRCLFPEPPPPEVAPSCAEAGVLGVMAGVVGSIQAAEAIKILLGIGESLSGRLLVYDALSASFESLKVARDPGCPICGDNPSITVVTEIETACPDESASGAVSITVAALAGALAGGSGPLLLDVRSAEEVALGAIGGAVHIPLSDLEGRACELPADVAIVAYCRSGTRSRAAMALLRSLGFGSVTHLEGGYMAWLESQDCSSA